MRTIVRLIQNGIETTTGLEIIGDVIDYRFDWVDLFPTASRFSDILKPWAKKALKEEAKKAGFTVNFKDMYCSER